MTGPLGRYRPVGGEAACRPAPLDLLSPVSRNHVPAGSYPAHSDVMPDHPEKIGKYTVLGLAGRGAMGSVYIGYDPFIERKVAIKVCSLSTEGDSNARLARKLFFNEAQSAGNLDNPHILRVYDAGEVNGEPYIAMEYVQGSQTLKSYITPEHLLPVESVLRMIHQCAKALDYAHRRGVTHRDIKPANILLTQEGEVKLGDFGIAQQTHTDKTQILGMFGSPRYMSPEQARDDVLTPQTDIYSLGVVLYELLCGRPPFTAGGIPQLIRMVLYEEPTPLREVRPDIPERLAAIVHRALEKDLAKRYRTADEMAADLAMLYEDLNRPPQELSEEERFAAARSLRFFNDFSDSELEEVLAASAWESYAPRQRIIAEGTAEHAFFIIVSGDVAVTIEGKTIARLTKGDCVGEMGYLQKTKRSASVDSEGDVVVMKIDSSLMEWASIPCQMRFRKVFEEVLIERLARTSLELAKHLD